MKYKFLKVLGGGLLLTALSCLSAHAQNNASRLPLELNSQQTYDNWANTLSDGVAKGNWEWYSSVPAARIFVYGTTRYDDYLTSPAIELKAGKTYSITFKTSSAEYLADGTNDRPLGEVHVLYGKESDALSDFSVLKEIKDLPYTTDISEFVPETVYLEVKEDGNYKVSFHSLTKIHVADVLVDEVESVNAPAAIEDLTATPKGTSTSVDIAFTVPTKKITGADYEAGTQLTVKVMRGEKEVYNGNHAIGELVSFTDTEVPEGDVTYTAVAYNGEDASSPAEVSCWVGELVTILSDSFAGSKFNAVWTVESTNTVKWTPAASASRISAYPQDNDGGLLFYDTNSASSSNNTRLISPELNTAAASAPVVSFYLFHYNTTHAGNKVEVAVKKDGGEWITVGTTPDIKDKGAEGWGWNKYSFTIREEIAGSNTYQVSFKGCSSYYDALAIDNVLIENNPQAYFKITDLNVTPVDGGYSIDWKDPDTDEALTYDIVRYVDGNKSAEFSDVTSKPYVDKYEPEGIVTMYYQVTAKTPSLATAPATSAEFKAGSFKLPFEDSFANKTMNEAWENKADVGSSYKWEVTSSVSGVSGPQDNDGGFIYYNTFNATKYSTATLITPPLSKASSTNPFVEFYINGQPGSSATLDLRISVDGGEFTDIDGSHIVLGQVPSGWTEYSFSLADLVKDSQTYQVAFVGTSDYGSYRMALDNIRIHNKAEYDLAVSEISGPTSIIAGNQGEYKFTVTNNGGHEVSAEDYEININAGDFDIEPVELRSIPAGGSVDYTFVVDYTAHHVSEQAYVFNAGVKFDADEVEDNNTSADFETVVSYSEKEGVANVTAEYKEEESTITVVWDLVMDVDGYSPVDIAESFETCEPGETVKLGQFTSAVGEGAVESTGSWYSLNSFKPKVYNKSQVTNSYAPKPSDGDQYLFSYAQKLDHWIISPELDCFRSAIMNLSFDMANSASVAITLELRYSTTDTDIESFTEVVESRSINTSDVRMTRYNFSDIPANAKYVAIHLVTEKAAGFFMDNIKITDEFEPVLGYHVYEEGVGRLTDEMLDPTATKFVLPVGEEMAVSEEDKITRAFTVTAVYGEGESAKSAPALVDITVGIDDVTVDDENGVVYYNLQGMRVKNPEKGVYIRVEGEKAVKVIK